MARTLKMLTLLAAVAVLPLAGCGKDPDSPTGKKMKENAVLGKLPALEAYYAEASAQKRQEFDEAKKDLSNTERIAKLSEEFVALEKEWGAKIADYVKSAGIVGRQVPFTALEDRPYTIEGVILKYARKGDVIFEVSLKLNKDLTDREIKDEAIKRGFREDIIRTRFKAVDADGKTIEGSKKALASGFKKDELTEGKTWTVSYSVGTAQIINMGDFAKIVEITHEEYQQK